MSLPTYALSLFSPLLPRLHDLPDRFLEALGDIPAGVVRLHFPQVAVVADVVADAVLIDVGVLLFLAGEFLGDRKGLEDGAAVIFASTEVVDLGHARCLDKGGHEAGDVEGVDVVADLFPLVAEDAVFLPLEVALHKVAEEAMELDSGVVGPGEAAATQAAGGHVEVAAVFLSNDVGGDLGGTEEGVLALVDGEVLGDTMRICRVIVIPPCLKFLERDGIGAVAVDFIRRHMDERRLGACSAGGLEHVQGPDSIRIKIIERNGRSPVMTGLGRGVDDGIRLYLGNQINDSLSVTNIKFVMDETLDIALETLLIPSGIALGAEKDGSLIVVDSMDLISKFLGKIMTYLRTDQA